MQEKLCVCQDFFGCNLNSFAKKQQKEKSDSAMESDFSNEPAIWLNIIVLFPQEYLTNVGQKIKESDLVMSSVLYRAHFFFGSLA